MPASIRGLARLLDPRAGILALALALSATASAAAYPERPIRLVVPVRTGRRHRPDRPHARGRHVDANSASRSSSTTSPAPARSSAPMLVAKSAPDGYNIVIATFAHAVNPSLQPKLPYATRQGIRADHADRQRPQRAGGARRQPVTRPSRTFVEAARAKPGTPDLRFAGQRHLGSPGRRDVHQPRQGSR